jgi:hypothetical protein
MKSSKTKIIKKIKKKWKFQWNRQRQLLIKKLKKIINFNEIVKDKYYKKN